MNSNNLLFQTWFLWGNVYWTLGKCQHLVHPRCDSLVRYWRMFQKLELPSIISGEENERERVRDLVWKSVSWLSSPVALEGCVTAVIIRSTIRSNSSPAVAATQGGSVYFGNSSTCVCSLILLGIHNILKHFPPISNSFTKKSSTAFS